MVWFVVIKLYELYLGQCGDQGGPPWLLYSHGVLDRVTRGAAMAEATETCCTSVLRCYETICRAAEVLICSWVYVGKFVPAAR